MWLMVLLAVAGQAGARGPKGVWAMAMAHEPHDDAWLPVGLSVESRGGGPRPRPDAWAVMGGR